MVLKTTEYPAQVVFQNPSYELVLQLAILDKVAHKIIKTFLDVSVLRPERDPYENCFASLLLLSPLICFHLHCLYWLGNPPPPSLAEFLMALPFYSIFSSSPYMTLQGMNAHSTSFQVGRWLSYLNNGCSISTPAEKRNLLSSRAGNPHTPQRRLPGSPTQHADKPIFWYLKAGKETSHTSSPLFEQDWNLLEQIKPKKGNSIEIDF